jgi:hypothetical protein
LVDNNSVVLIQPNTQAGMYSWRVEGWEQVNQQWFWYGVGNGPVASIDTISAPTIILRAREAAISYSNAANFSISVDYSVAGGTNVPIGPGYGTGWAVSEVDETITVSNRSGRALPFHLYEYAHFDLTYGYDTASLKVDPRTGLYTEADQYYSPYPAGYSVKSVTTNGANFGEVAPVGQTLQELNSGGPVTLDDNNGPFGPGYVTWALEWDLNIAPGSSATIGMSELAVDLRNVPEPSEATLLGLGLVGLRFWRRRPQVVPGRRI